MTGLEQPMRGGFYAGDMEGNDKFLTV